MSSKPHPAERAIGRAQMPTLFKKTPLDYSLQLSRIGIPYQGRSALSIHPIHGLGHPRLDTPLCLGCKSRVPFALAAESRTAIEAAGSVLSVIVKEPGR